MQCRLPFSRSWRYFLAGELIYFVSVCALPLLCHNWSDMSEGSWFFEKNFNGVPDEFFDDVVKFLDFPLEDIEKNVEEDGNAQFQKLGEACFDSFAVPQPRLCNTPDDGSLVPSKPVTAQYIDISKPRQHPEASETRSSNSILCDSNKVSDVKDVTMLQIYSPVSVFESTSSCSVENHTFGPAILVKRARSKRRRISCHSPLFSTSFVFSFPVVEDSENVSASGIPSGSKMKRRRKELSVVSGTVEMKLHGNQDFCVPRKCTHCEVTKTPQWREGPMGPKTLCNACGVRYKSGRLFPEYRPAASPTFVAALHSNCHKKVVEMRSKAKQ